MGIHPAHWWSLVLAAAASASASAYPIVTVWPSLVSARITDCPQLVAMARASPTPNYGVVERGGALYHPDSARLTPR